MARRVRYTITEKGKQYLKAMTTSDIEQSTLRRALIEFDNADKSTDELALAAFQRIESYVERLANEQERKGLVEGEIHGLRTIWSFDSDSMLELRELAGNRLAELKAQLEQKESESK